MSVPNVGYGFGNDHNQTDLLLSGSLATSEPGTSVTPKGGLGGVQLGYNWQAARTGSSASKPISRAPRRTTPSAHPRFALPRLAAVPPVNEIITVQHQLDYFGTVRGRLGYLYNNTLFYGTGGAAFGHVRETIHVILAGAFADPRTTKDLAGYAVGGGIEAMLSGGWSAKAEYLYMNLGSISSTVDVNLGGPVTLSTNSTVRDHIVRVGLNYHIGAAPY